MGKTLTTYNPLQTINNFYALQKIMHMWNNEGITCQGCGKSYVDNSWRNIKQLIREHNLASTKQNNYTSILKNTVFTDNRAFDSHYTNIIPKINNETVKYY